MKRAIFILTLGYASSFRRGARPASARHARLEIRGGMADGFYPGQPQRNGLLVRLAMSHYAKKMPISGCSARGVPEPLLPLQVGTYPVAQFTAEGGYYYKFLADPSRTFFFTSAARRWPVTRA